MEEGKRTRTLELKKQSDEISVPYRDTHVSDIHRSTLSDATTRLRHQYQGFSPGLDGTLEVICSLFGEVMGIADVLFCVTLVLRKGSSVDVSARVPVMVVSVALVDGDAVEVVLSSVDV